MEPFEYEAGLESATGALSALSDELGSAYEAFDEVEAEWDAHRDTIAEDLKDQMVDEGRKGDPADHWVTSVARRRKPELYAEFRRCKRAIDRLNTQSSNRRSELTGYQSLLKSEHAMAGTDNSQADRRGLPVHGQRRAA